MLRFRILPILEEQNHTKYWLYKTIGMTNYRNFDNLINNRTRSIQFDTLEKISDALACPIDDLFERVDEDDLDE